MSKRIVKKVFLSKFIRNSFLFLGVILISSWKMKLENLRPLWEYPLWERPLWGFFGHQRINRLAVFTLPPEMFKFYKSHIEYITENAVNPDQRRYALKEEAPRHFIDLDNYSDTLRKKLPTYSWKEVTEKISEDTLNRHGIVPWHINFMKFLVVIT